MYEFIVAPVTAEILETKYTCRIDLSRCNDYFIGIEIPAAVFFYWSQLGTGNWYFQLVSTGKWQLVFSTGLNWELATGIFNWSQLGYDHCNWTSTGNFPS